MSYDFTPLSEEELNDLNIIDEGIYNFEVVKSIRRTSKAGNPMCELTLKFWDSEGKIHTLFDYLVFSSIGLNIRKIKHFCDSVGLVEKYKQGSLPEEFAGYSGKVHVGIQEEKPNPNGGFYAKKNIVTDYVVTELGAVKYESTEKPFVDSDLPF